MRSEFSINNLDNNYMITHSQILAAVSIATEIPIEQIEGRCRKDSICEARHLYAYFLRRELELTYHQIAAIVKRDHSSCHHSVAEIERFRSYEDERILDLIWKIRKML